MTHLPYLVVFLVAVGHVTQWFGEMAQRIHKVQAGPPADTRDPWLRVNVPFRGIA